MRPPRICFVGGIYHVTVRCNNREFSFFAESDFSLFLQILRKAKNLYRVHVYAYCLTNNHVHLVLGTPYEANLSKFMQYVNGNFAQAYNRSHNKTGHFWGERFHSTIIESETQFFYTALYVEFNMVRCKAVADPADWQWSSYHAHALGKRDPAVDFHPLYLALGNTPEERQSTYLAMAVDRLHETGLRQEPALARGVILGSKDFVESLLEEYGSRISYYHDRKTYEFEENCYSLYRSAGDFRDTG